MSGESGAVDYQWRDFLTLARDLPNRGPRWRPWLTSAVAIVAVLGFSDPFHQRLWVLVILMVVVLFAIWIANRAIPYLLAAQMRWAYDRNPHRGAQYFRVGADQLEIETPHGQARINWLAVDAVRMRKDCLLIYVSRRTAYLIPGRAFDTPGHFRDFTASAEERWSAARQ